MKWIIILLFLFLPSICFAQDEWDTIDKLLLSGFIASSTIDCFQTNYIFEYNYSERNLIIEKGVENMGKIFIPLFFATKISVGYIFSDKLPSPYRKAALALILGSSLLCITHNNSSGIGFAISF